MHAQYGATSHTPFNRSHYTSYGEAEDKFSPRTSALRRLSHDAKPDERARDRNSNSALQDGWSPRVSALKHLEHTRDARAEELMKERLSSSGMTPRYSGMKRLDSTRELRHGDVVIERNEGLTSMDPSKDPLRKIQEEGLYLNLTSRTNNTITVEWTYCPAQSWMPIDHFILEHSSITNPDFTNVKLASNQRQFVLRNCTPGTNNFFVVSSVDVYGKVIIRSKQLTVQSSAPVDRPILRLKKNLPNVITIEWNRPSEYGDGFISEYHLMVNGVFYTNIRSTKTSFDYIECRPMQNYTFRIQALAMKHDCNSEWSNVLDVCCPAALPITLKRLPPKTINTVKVGWNIPSCVGGAKVKEYKVYFKEASTYELYNDQEQPDPDKIFGHRHNVVKTIKPDSKESTCCIEVDPRQKYWAILKAEITPEGCPDVVTSAVRVRATMKPVPPQIKISVYGKHEREEADKEIAIILDKQDKIKRRREILHSSEIVTGAELKNDEIQNMNVMLYQMEKRMQELVKVVNRLTGFVPVVLTWEKPEFDEFSEPTSYRVNVDGQSYQDSLPLDDTEHSLKLDVEKASHTLSVTTLSWHPVGHSEQSNVEVVDAKGFRPNRFFCYFTSHNKNAKWPSKGGCRLEDFLLHEKKLTSKNNVHRGLLKTRVTPKPFRVMGVHDATWQWLIRHFGAKKPTIILFWTKWCISSQVTLEHFATFASEKKDKYQYLACCIKSGEDIHSHRKSIIELLNEKNIRSRGNIRHCCACHPAPDLPHNTVEKMENASIPASFDLAGVPTFVVLDIKVHSTEMHLVRTLKKFQTSYASKGQLSWQGRVAADTDETFDNYMSHVMLQVEEQDCPNMDFQHCKDEEEGVKFKGEEQDDVNEINIEGGEKDSYKPNEMFSLDEFHLLHSRLHGKRLDDAEKTENEQYATVGSLSPRKEWLERRRANAKKAGLTSADVEKQRVRFIDVNGEAPGDRTENGRSQSKSNDFRSYPYRQPGRNYRSPNNAYDKPQTGYGSRMSSSWRDTNKVGSPRELPDDMENSRKSGLRYSSVSYHDAEKISTGDDEHEEDHREYETSKNKGTSLAYQSSNGNTPKWSSAIKANNVSRDTSRGNDFSSTWPRSGFAHQEEEIYEFMIPSNQREPADMSRPSYNGFNGFYPQIGNKNSAYHSSPDLRKTNGQSQPYIYTRPSTRTFQEKSGNTKPPKSGKDRFSHIKSRYGSSYKPGNEQSQRGVISARHNQYRLIHTSSGRKSAGRGLEKENIPRLPQKKQISKSARGEKREHAL